MFENTTNAVLYFVFVALVSCLFLVGFDLVSDQEVPANLPDCEEDEVLDYVVYDADVDKRVYKCVHVEDL